MGCADKPTLEQELHTYLLPLVRLGDARVGDDFGRINFAGGEVGHLIALRKPSLDNRGKKTNHIVKDLSLQVWLANPEKKGSRF